MVSVSCLSAMLTTVVAMFLSHQVVPVDACVCAPQHPQSEYCAADWAIKAKVKTKQLVKDQTTDYEQYLMRYTVKIKRVFKGKQHLANGTIQKLYTMRDDSLCGASLELNTTYYIQGMTQKGLLRFHICNNPREWSSIQPMVQKWFKKVYQKNCRCTIEESKHTQNTSKGSCKIISSWDDNQKECYKNTNVCVHRKKHNSCKWARRHAFRDCVDKGSFNSEP